MKPDPHTHCQRCSHHWRMHGPDGCFHQQGGYICDCRTTNDDTSAIRLASSPPSDLMNEVKRLEAENNERFSRETDYQNRIRELEVQVRALKQVLRDILYYAQQKL